MIGSVCGFVVTTGALMLAMTVPVVGVAVIAASDAALFTGLAASSTVCGSIGTYIGISD
jgi:hypothetical protein